MRTIALSTNALQKQRCAKRLLLHGSSTTTQPTQNEWNKVFLQISQRLCVTSRTSSHLGSGPTSRTTYSSPAVSSRAMRRAASVLDRESTAKVIVFSTVALHHEQKWYFAPFSIQTPTVFHPNLYQRSRLPTTDNEKPCADRSP